MSAIVWYGLKKAEISKFDSMNEWTNFDLKANAMQVIMTSTDVSCDLHVPARRNKLLIPLSYNFPTQI